MLKKFPHTYVIIFFIIIACTILTWLIPSGEFDRTDKVVNHETGKTQNIIVPGSYHAVDSEPQSWHVFSAIFKGFRKQTDIIIFILLIGGAFWIMNATRAIDVGIMAFLKTTRKLERISLVRKLGVNNIVMSLIMFMFSIFGAVFGMSEETMAFVIIMVPLAISMGYDSITGVCLVYVAAHLGFAGAILNPFTIGIAQGIADIDIFSGLEYRFICWLLINIVGFTFILRYASKVKKDPSKSLVYETDEYWRNRQAIKEDEIIYHTPISAWVAYGLSLLALIVFAYFYSSTKLEIGGMTPFEVPILPICAGLFALFGFLSLLKSVHFFVLNLLAFTIIFLIIGVMSYGWYVLEIGTLFFAMGITSGISANNSANKITLLFLDGAKDILSAALIVGLAGGIIIILTDGKIVDTIMDKVSGSMNGIGKSGSLGVMYLIQTFINVFIPSGSGQAALTMPIMAPLSDLVGISRQSAVMAFQFGDGFTNMITPTSGVLIGVLGIAKIPYQKWFRWIAPLMVILIILGFLLLLPTIIDGFNMPGFNIVGTL